MGSFMAKIKLPREAREKFKSARDFIKQREVDAARAVLLEIELGSSFMLFHRLMAAGAFIEKDYDLASSHIEQAIALEPASQVLIADAIRIYKANNNNQRTSELLNLIDTDKSESSAELLKVALVLKPLEKYLEASEFLEKALRLSPENVRIRTLYGVILTCLGRSQDALQQWKFSLKYDPENVVTKVCLGRMYLHQKDFLKSIDYFKQTLGNDSDIIEGRKLNLAEAYIRASSLTEARQLLSSTKGVDDSPRLHYLWGLLHFGSGDYYLSRSSFNRCIELGREGNNPLMNKLVWADQFLNEDSAREEIKNVQPQLDSIFDSLSMLKAANRNDEIRSEAQFDLNSDNL